ncbi:MAG: DedA family protein [Desulfomonilaceae bacterium]
MEMTSVEILNWVTLYGYLGIFALLMLGIVGIPVPDELVLTCAGFLAFKGYLVPELTVACAFMGSVCGISLSYGLGRFVGMTIIYRYGYLAHITPEMMGRIEGWYERFGKWLLLFGYFIAAARHLTAFAAGITRLRVSVFALFAYPGAFLWSITFISLGYFLGDRWTLISKHLSAEFWLAVAVVGGLAALSFVRRRKSARP